MTKALLSYRVLRAIGLKQNIVNIESYSKYKGTVNYSLKLNKVDVKHERNQTYANHRAYNMTLSTKHLKNFTQKILFDGV